MKKVGIIGGIGPVSTMDYYWGIIEGCQSVLMTDDYPEIVLESLNMTEMLSFVAEKRWDDLTDYLLTYLQNVADSGAEVGAIASNTPHIVFDRLGPASPLPLISIVEETCQAAKRQGLNRILVLGTWFTMVSGIYQSALERWGISSAVPSEEEQKIIQGIIFPNLENGIVVPEEKEKLLEITRRLIQQHDLQAVILGCTELPLILNDGDLPVPLLNTTRIHIDAIVREITARVRERVAAV